MTVRWLVWVITDVYFVLFNRLSVLAWHRFWRLFYSTLFIQNKIGRSILVTETDWRVETILRSYLELLYRWRALECSCCSWRSRACLSWSSSICWPMAWTMAESRVPLNADRSSSIRSLISRTSSLICS